MNMDVGANTPHFAARRLVSPVNSHNEWDPLEEIIVGRLESKASYGHLGMYPYRFVATCVESIQPLGHFRNLPDQKK